MGKIRVAIAGVGNVASSLIQGVYYYKGKDEKLIPGLMHVDFGGYKLEDIEFVAAFDVDERKIGKDLSEAILSEPNMIPKFVDLPRLGVTVEKGPVLDGVAPHMKDFRYGEGFKVDDSRPPVDVAEKLKEAEADMLINLVPVGSARAARAYAQACLDAGVAFINGMPEFIVSDPEWAAKFKEAGIPAAGDDVKSQLGATILHRAIVKLMVERGVVIDETYQLNIGGNMDFLNMIEEERLKTKRISKTQAVTSMIPYEIPTRVGPSDYVPFLEDRKICYIWVKARNFGDFPIYLDVKLNVPDSPNAAGVLVDAIRAVKIALDRNIAGPLISISAYCFKHPPEQYPDYLARQMVEEFIKGERER